MYDLRIALRGARPERRGARLPGLWRRECPPPAIGRPPPSAARLSRASAVVRVVAAAAPAVVGTELSVWRSGFRRPTCGAIGTQLAQLSARHWDPVPLDRSDNHPRERLDSKPMDQGGASRQARRAAAGVRRLHQLQARRRAHAGRVRRRRPGRRPDVRRRGARLPRGQAGLPFVGQAGKLLDKLLEGIGLCAPSLHRERPQVPPAGQPRSRPDEIESCEPHLFQQIELIEPR